MSLFYKEGRVSTGRAGGGLFCEVGGRQAWWALERRRKWESPDARRAKGRNAQDAEHPEPLLARG